MKLNIRFSLFVISLMCTLLSGCGGGSSGTLTSIVTILGVSQPGYSAQEAFRIELQALEMSGIETSNIRCARSLVFQPFGAFYFIVDVPDSQVPLTVDRRFSLLKDIAGGESKLFSIECALV